MSPETISIVVPQLGNAMDDVTIVEWLVEVGEPVEQGEPVVIIESDKAQSELEAPATGVVVAVRVQDGDTVEVGAVLAEIEVAR